LQAKFCISPSSTGDSTQSRANTATNDWPRTRLKQAEHILSYPEFRQRLSRDNVAPVYLFFGDEPFLMERALAEIVGLVVDPQLRDVTISVFEADSVDQKTICSEARTVPFLAAKRLVVVRKAHRLELRSRKAPVALYLDNPCSTTCLVLIAAQMGERQKKGETRDTRKKRQSKLVSLAGRHGVVVNFPALNAREVIRWVEGEVARLGKKISPRAAAELQQLAGKSLSQVNNELQKVVTYVGAKERIDHHDVIAAVSDVHHETTYALADAFGDQNVVEALEVLDILIRDGEKATTILWRMNWQLNRLYTALMLLEQGIKPQEIARQLRVMPFYRRRFFEQTRKFTMERLRKLFQVLVDAELQLKSTSIDPRLLLELVIVKMCGGGSTIAGPVQTVGQ